MRERKKRIDQLGTVREYNYDKLGRWIADRVTTFASGVDDTVKMIYRTFAANGRIATVSSHGSASLPPASYLNEVKRTYGLYRQLLAESQEHGGAVTGSSKKVQYSYATANTNHVRRTGMTYANGTTLTYGYASSSTASDVLSRPASLSENSQTTNYTYLGWERRVRVNLPTASSMLNLIKLSGESNGSGGDQYTGLDLFNRVSEMRWHRVSSPSESGEWGQVRGMGSHLLIRHFG